MSEAAVIDVSTKFGSSDEEVIDAALARSELDAGWFPAVARIDPAGLSQSYRLRLAVATHRLIAVAEALDLRAVAAVPTQRCDPDTHTAACVGGTSCTHHWETEELACLTRQSTLTVGRRQTSPTP